MTHTENWLSSSLECGVGGLLLKKQHAENCSSLTSTAQKPKGRAAGSRVTLRSVWLVKGNGGCGKHGTVQLGHCKSFTRTN